MKYIHKYNLSRIVLIFTRATCCLLYLCVIDTIHRSGNSKLNFATANFHVTATFQIHYFSFLEWLFLFDFTLGSFSYKKIPHQKSCLFHNALILMACVYIYPQENLWNDQVYSFQTKVCLQRFEPAWVHQNSIWDALTNQIQKKTVVDVKSLQSHFIWNKIRMRFLYIFLVCSFFAELRFLLW